MDIKSEKIMLVGKAACGKDFLSNWLINKGLKKAVSYTTRPMRDGEVNGIDYHFISEQDFLKMDMNGEFYESEKFNDWYYGSSKIDFDNSNLFIKTPSGILNINEDDRKNCFIVYLDIDEDVRKSRLMLRSDADLVDRRIIADNLDFTNFREYDMRITDSDFDPQMIYDFMD